MTKCRAAWTIIVEVERNGGNIPHSIQQINGAKILLGTKRGYINVIADPKHTGRVDTHSRRWTPLAGIWLGKIAPPARQRFR